MKNNRIVVDTNVFINGWFFGEEHIYCQKIMELIDTGEVRLLFSQDTIGELMYLVKNFARHNIDDVDTRIAMLQSISTLFYYSMSINTLDCKVPKINDEYDEMFLECAIQGNADYLITNDYRSGMHDVKDIKTKIVNSEEFIKVMGLDAVAIEKEK